MSDNPAFDDLLRRARAASDVHDRKTLLGQAYELARQAHHAASPHPSCPNPISSLPPACVLYLRRLDILEVEPSYFPHSNLAMQINRWFDLMEELYQTQKIEQKPPLRPLLIPTNNTDSNLPCLDPARKIAGDILDWCTTVTWKDKTSETRTAVPPEKAPTSHGAEGNAKEVGEGVADRLATPVTVSPPSATPRTPKVYLCSWRDILTALGLKNNAADQSTVKKLQKEYDGPIALPPKGGQPKVEHAALLNWWNGLEALFQAKKDRERDIEATTSDQHAYGRTGEVAPDIGGAIKKRRSDQVPKRREGPKTS
jgi:hypothetical protein